MYKILDFDKSLDLDKFYFDAKSKGFENNSSQELLYDSFAHFKDFKVWLLYYENTCIGSVALHSLEELGILGENAYRIAARTCILNHLAPIKKSLRNGSGLHRMDHLTSQILIPLCISYVKSNPMYISTNNSKVGSQHKVHRTWTKIMKNLDFVEDSIELEYRNSFQHFWKLKEKNYLNKLKENQWPEAREALKNYLNYNLI